MSSGDAAPGAGIGTVRRDGRTDPFFDGAARDRLVIRRCEPCDRWYAPDASGCPGCGAEEPTWAEASGAAVLVSWAVAHPRGGEPAPLALVELAEGPWMYARLRAVAGPREGLPLRAVFVHPDDGESYPVFEEDAGASRPDPGTGARPGANRRVGDMGAPRPAPEEDTGRGGDGPAARTPGDGAEHRPVPGEHREDLRGER